MRVNVFSDKVEYLGQGEYVEDVPVWFAQMPGGIPPVMIRAEEPPDEQAISEATNAGGKVVVRQIPKIILDSGETVYGCRVWYFKIEDKGQG